MIEPKARRLFHDPWQVYVDAEIVTLTPEMADAHISSEWWDEDCLRDEVEPPLAIDRHWNWNELAIEYEGRQLAAEKVAMIAGSSRPLQGAAMISSEPIACVHAQCERALFLELLFTAPRNRANLRKDGKHFLRGVGLELLRWSAWFSRHSGHAGRLLLDSSPDQVGWYQKRGLIILGLEPILYEGVRYTPMELPANAADDLLRGWVG